MLGIGNPKAASGTPYFIAKALGKKYGDVIDISPRALDEGGRLDRFKRDPAYMVKQNINRLLKRRTIPCLYRPAYQRVWARQIESNIAKYKPDIIFADKCAAFFCYLKTDVPIIYRSDATFVLMDGFYPEFSGYSKSDKNLIDVAERASLLNCTYFIPISEWVKNSAVRDYSISPEKCMVIRSHASLANEVSVQPKSFDKNIQKIKFLFVGADWHRKGGDLAVEAINNLVKAGYNVEFNILCKSAPSEIKDLPYVNLISFIDRSSESGSRQYHQLFSEAHFFFMPTKAECMGQVFIDALMHGLPSIALDVGAVPEVVVPNKTGLLFPVDAGANLMAEKIKSLISDPDAYAQISTNAINLYRSEFSSDVFYERLEILIKRISCKSH